MLWALMKWGTINTLLCNMYTEQLETVLEHISVTEVWRLSFTASETSRHLILCITDKLEIVVQHIKNIKIFCAFQTSWRFLSSTSKASRPSVHYKQVGDCHTAHHNLQDILFCALQTCCRQLSSTSKTSRHLCIADTLEIVVQHVTSCKTFYFVRYRQDVDHRSGHYRQVVDCNPVH